MKLIKLNFSDFWPSFDSYNNFFIDQLSKKYKVEITDSPDYLFFSVYGSKHLKYDCVKIFFTGEAVAPNFNIADYAIGFDFIEYTDRYLRWPMYRIYREYFNTYNLDSINKVDKNHDSKFCSFVYSNPASFTSRDEFMRRLSEYKKVDSGGKHLNNLGYFVKDKVIHESKYKFSIAFENVNYPGYTSEKIIDAFQAGTVPIYFGNPRINEDFISARFINVHDYNSYNEAIQAIIEVDSDDELFNYYQQQDVVLNYDQQDFVDFLENIFDQDLANAIRVHKGYYQRKEILRQKIVAVFERLFITNGFLNLTLYNGKFLVKRK
jgi:alpha(1,3/1,4) fucosyltransferase